MKAVHGVPQDPQLLRSLLTSVQIPPQITWPAGHPPQIPAVQTWPWQSVPTTQPFPLAQAGQEPPQSMSVSLPSFTPLAHVEAFRQTPLMQLNPAAQVWPHDPQ